MPFGIIVECPFSREHICVCPPLSDNPTVVETTKALDAEIAEAARLAEEAAAPSYSRVLGRRARTRLAAR